MTKILNGALAVLAFGLGTSQDGYCQSSLTNGLVAYYPFNGNANDESGNGHDGVVIGATPATDRFGLAEGATYFNVFYMPNVVSGSNVVVVPKIEDLNFNHDFTISLWLYRRSLWLLDTLISCAPGSIDFGPTNIYVGVGQSFYPGQDQLTFAWGTYPKSVIILVPQAPRTWWQVAVVRSGRALSLYRNGLLLTNTVIEAAPDWQQMWLGMDQSGRWPLDGQMDDVRLYNRALSASEVKQLYEFEGPPFAGADKLIHLYYSDLKVGTNYQPEDSSDLANWADSGEPFTAVSTTTNSFHEIGDGSTYWRLKMSAEQGGGDPVPLLRSARAVKLLFAHLSVGTNYQLQFSRDMTVWNSATWVDQGPVLTATEPTLVYPEYLDVPDWGSPVFRLKARP